MSKEIGSPHNNLFQNILGREDMARDFIRYYMPAEIVGDLDLDTLEVAAESYISDDLKESLSDIVTVHGCRFTVTGSRFFNELWVSSVFQP